MQLIDMLTTPGEHPLFLNGVVGQLEAVLSIPIQSQSQWVALLGHPHSLQGGTMNNKVVTTMARVFKDLGIPSLRFNFRGVGQSAGLYDEGIGEGADMIALAKEWQEVNPGLRFIFAGFSFGSYVAYRAATEFENSVLITIAPPVHHYDYQTVTPRPTPWLIVQGKEDEIVPAQLVHRFAQDANPPITLIELPNATHFFHGQLIELKTQLTHFLRSQVSL